MLGGRFRLIASDLDGTLFAPGAELAERTIDVLGRIRERGVHVVAATGRSHRSAISRLAPSGVIDRAICSNGATVFDLDTNLVVRHRAIDPAAVATLFAAARTALPDVGLAWEEPSGFAFDAGFDALRPTLDEMGPHWGQGATADDHRPDQAIKILIAHPTLVRNDLLELLRPTMPSDVTLATSGATFVEVTGAAVDKASTLAQECADLGVAASEVIAFGDHNNDLPLLRWAGHGVAMGNAHPEVAEAADAQTATNADHGVAVVLEQLLAEG